MATPTLDALLLDDLDQLRLLFDVLSRLPRQIELAAWSAGMRAEIDAEIYRRSEAITRALGEDPPPRPVDSTPRIGLDRLSDGDLVALHGIATDAIVEDRGQLGRWAVRLGRLITNELDRREAAQDDLDSADPNAALDRARFAALAAEEQQHERAARPAPDLTGLPSWRETSDPGSETR